MFDLMDHFVLFVMDGFYHSLEDDLKRWTENLGNAITDNNQKGIDTAIERIQNYRGLMNELGDANMGIKDFVGLLVEKYGADRK